MKLYKTQANSLEIETIEVESCTDKSYWVNGMRKTRTSRGNTLWKTKEAARGCLIYRVERKIELNIEVLRALYKDLQDIG
tara:strand:- start:75 stop:314 length:240 start_codon:yes stop_codon:yes gene_type:complete